jgi:hypothetical protein
MNKYTFIYNLDVSSSYMDEGGSYTVVKIAFVVILIIEKKSLATLSIFLKIQRNGWLQVYQKIYFWDSDLKG